MLQVAYLPEGLEAIIFTADGDMRQALNNLQVFADVVCMWERASGALVSFVVVGGWEAQGQTGVESREVYVALWQTLPGHARAVGKVPCVRGRPCYCTLQERMVAVVYNSSPPCPLQGCLDTPDRCI